MTAIHPDARRASALVFVVAVLAVLSALGVALARVASLEARSSATRVEAVRARFLAEAGIERAVAELRAAATRPWDGPDVTWYYRGAPGRATGNGVLLETATRPSFFAGDLAYGRAISGSLPPTWEPLGDTYVVRVLDAASMIDLNQPVDPRLPDAQQPLVRMLTTLARAIDPADPPLTAAEAEMVLAYRQALPAGRYTDRSELLRIPGGPVTARDLEVLADFVTVHAWADPGVVAPADPSVVAAPGEFVHGRPPTGPVLIVPRRPVDANTAPPEVLAAVFAGVSAAYVETSIDRSPAGGASWHARGTSARTTPITFDQAIALADALVAIRESQPLRSWADLEAFLQGRIDSGAIDPLQGEAIRAAVDPNTNTHRGNPDALVHRRIDKFDLVASTTELAFHSGGVFEIESLGRVTADGGRIVAQARVLSAVEVFRLVRHSSQAHFAPGVFGTYVLDEPVLFQPETALLTRETLRLQGDVTIRGEGGSVHSNTDLEMTGNPYVAGDATATGQYVPSNETVVGVKGGGFPPMRIPAVHLSRYRSTAALVFGADGVVRDTAGTEVGRDQYAGFSKKGSTWSWKGPEQPSGILYFEGNVSMTSKTETSWEASFLATGHVSVRGAVQMRPAPGFGLVVIAGTDLEISGTPGSVVEGVAFVGEQIELGGNTHFLGTFMARGDGATDGLVRENRVHGNVVVEHNGDLPPLPLEWILTEHPAVTSHPEPDATVYESGVPVHLPSFAAYDGRLSLGYVTHNRSVLGGEPFTDRLLARWNDDTLDADAGGGPLGNVPDLGGPRIGPLVGEAVPGSLLADGLYSEFDAVGAFEAAGNVGAVRGTISFWIKPDGVGNRTRHLVALSRADDAGTQSFQLADVGAWSDPWAERTGFHFERSTLEAPPGERLVHASWSPPAHAWTHVAIVYDLLEPDPALAIRVYVDGGELPGAVLEPAAPRPLEPEETDRAPLTGGNLLRLGERVGADYQLPGTSPEATYDELVCLPWIVDASWAAGVHAAGRYWSGGPAWYESPPLPIPYGSRILFAAWTVRRPPDWPGPAPRLVLEDSGATFASTEDPAGLPLARPAGAETRYRVVFLESASSVPFYATPVVEDVTVAFAGPPRFLSWEVVR